MVSNHYRNKRYKRENIIKGRCNGDGRVIDSFVVDKGHKNGLERHDITDTGLIIVYNLESQKLVTKLIAREGQVRRLYSTIGKEPPTWLVSLCRWHCEMGYNKY